MRHIPIDSTDAREQREAEQAEAAAHDRARRQHDEHCTSGWLGEDDQGRPIACTRCRPHLAIRSCPTCGVAYSACVVTRLHRRRPCCDHCDHPPRQETHTP